MRSVRTCLDLGLGPAVPEVPSSTGLTEIRLKVSATPFDLKLLGNLLSM